MKIGLFGGTFDPPHRGHQQLVSAVLEQNLFDEVWYLPVAVHDPQFDKPDMSSAQHRLAMLELVQQFHRQRNEPTRLETFELDENLEGFTHRTLRRLDQQYPQHDFSFIIGSDQLASLHRWGCDLEAACFPEILEQFPFYVYPRGGHPITELPFADLRVIEDVEPVELSSTKIRRRVAEGEPIARLVIPEVGAYIAGHRLYQQL